MLFECGEIRHMWMQVKQYIEGTFASVPNHVNFEIDKLFLNNVVEPPCHVINLLVLFVKQYIYAQKCLSMAVSFQQCIKNFRQMYHREKYNASTSGCCEKHDKKWKSYVDGIEGDTNFVT